MSDNPRYIQMSAIVYNEYFADQDPDLVIDVNSPDITFIERRAYDKQREVIEELINALEFYSDDNDWGLDWDLVNNFAAIQDRGKVARGAISKAKEVLGE